MPTPIPPQAPPATLVYVPLRELKGCGTAWAIEHRFDPARREAFDDGWSTLEEAALADASPEAPVPATELREERVRSILAGNDSPDIGFDLSINPYRGCEHVMRRRFLFSGSLQDE